LGLYLVVSGLVVGEGVVVCCRIAVRRLLPVPRYDAVVSVGSCDVEWVEESESARRELEEEERRASARMSVPIIWRGKA
jgi:hypothetical protein